MVSLKNVSVFKFQADGTQEDLIEFYTKHNKPLVGHITMQNQDTRYKDTTKVMVFYTVDWSHDYRKGEFS